MIVSVKNKQGTVTVADSGLKYIPNLLVSRGELEMVVGRKLRGDDVVEATVEGQTYRCTISMRPKGRVLGILTGVNGKEVEHTLRIEDGTK
jgi:hypothetical protein